MRIRYRKSQCWTRRGQAARVGDGELEGVVAVRPGGRVELELARAREAVRSPFLRLGTGNTPTSGASVIGRVTDVGVLSEDSSDRRHRRAILGQTPRIDLGAVRWRRCRRKSDHP